MNTRPIEKMLVTLEKHADEIHADIDSVPAYIHLCAAVSDLDFGIELTEKTKRWVFTTLKSLYNIFGLDYDTVLRDILLGLWTE